METPVAARIDSVPYYQEIQDAFGRSGCPLCRLSTDTAERYLDAVLWELVNDVEVRAELNRAHGYCQQHGWLLVRAGASLGVAILMRDVVRTLLDTLAANAVEEAPEARLQHLLWRLRRGRTGGQTAGEPGRVAIHPEPVSAPGPRVQPPRSKAAARLSVALSPENRCPVCALVQARAQDHMSTLLAHLEGPGGLLDAYLQSDGLCLDHFRQALGQARSGSQAMALVDAQRSVWQRLLADLDEFIRKSDQRFRDEPFGEERDAWRRALAAISGPPPRGQSARQGLV